MPAHTHNVLTSITGGAGTTAGDVRNIGSANNPYPTDSAGQPWLALNYIVKT